MSEPEHGPSAAVPVGELVGGRFRLEAELGSGGMATVYRAFDVATRRSMALKLLKREIANEREAMQRLKREGEVLSSLAHPAIVRIETFGALEDGRLFLAMELLEGETLGARMRRGPMQPGDIAPIVAGAAAGLAAAHAKGVVHRDLKPDNIFLCAADAGAAQVKLLDFGISKVVGSDRLTQTGEILGTPRYMAPEQLSAERDVDGRVDVYALGVILFEALAGSTPFVASSPTDLIVSILQGKVAALRSFRPDLSTDLEAVVARAMARSREARFATAAELADAFIDVAGSVRAAAAARSGMRTNVLGSMSSGAMPASPVATPKVAMKTAPVAAAPLPAAPAETPRAPLHVGTFSALAAPLPAAARVPDAPAPRAPVAHGADVTERRPAVPVAVASAPAPAPASAGPRIAQPKHADTASYQLPMKRSRWPLIVAGLLAGAASAAIAITALQLLRRNGASAAEAAPAPVTAPAPAAVQGQAPAPPPRVAAAPPVEPTAATAEPPAKQAPAPLPPTPSDSTAADETAVQRVRSGGGGASRVRRQTSPSGGSGGAAPSGNDSAALEAPQPESGLELLDQARAALRRGESRQCIALLDRAVAIGAPAVSLRVRGDCLVQMGDRVEALKAYERFCRALPDHPSMPEVRGIVESLGGRCD